MDIIIPHFNANQYRERNLKFTLDYYSKNSPDTHIYLTEQVKSDAETSEVKPIKENVSHVKLFTSDEHFRKSSLINLAMSVSQNNIIMMVDNDCILGVDELKNAEKNFKGHDIFFPYTDINFLNEGHTRQLIRTGKFKQRKQPFRLHMNRYTGGVVMFSKLLFHTVGGFDDEIKGWGKEDDAFLTKCKRVAAKIGRPDGEHILLHLFHPPMGIVKYAKKPRFILNSEMLAVLKRMTEEDFLLYLERKKNGYGEMLASFVKNYKRNGKLEISTSVRCGGGEITFDTSAYDVLPDENGNIGIEEVLKAAYNDDGLETLKFTLNLIDIYCKRPNIKEQKIINKYKNFIKMQ